MVYTVFGVQFRRMIVHTKMGTRVKIFIASLCLFVLSAPLLSVTVHAQDRYVSDTLYVPLRSGMGNQYRIVHSGLSSGTQLELIREDEADDGESWSLVRTTGGEEGWVRSQFLLDEPTAALQLAEAERRAETIAEENRSLEQNLAEARSETEQLSEELEQLQNDYASLQEEHEELRELSSDAVGLHEQHQELSENYQMLQTRQDVIQADNERLKKEKRYQDWLFGGGILLAGVLLSLILQAIGKRRRQSEWR